MENSKKKLDENNKSDVKKNNVVRNIIIIIALGGVVAIILANFRNNLEPKMKLLTLPLITTENYSETDGEYHEVSMNVSFGSQTNTLKNLGTQELEKITTEAISKLSYDEMNKPDGLEYVKEEIKDYVIQKNSSLADEEFKVYISGVDFGLINGFLPGLVEENNASKTNEVRTKQLESMFGGKNE